MAVKTYKLDTTQDGNFAQMFEGDTAVATRTGDGWTVGKVAAGNSSEFNANNLFQPTGSFSLNSTTPKPASLILGSGGFGSNAFKAPSGSTTLTGTFAATAWTFTFAVRATVASSQAGRIRLRVFKSVNATGSSATELTGATQVGTTSSALSTTADVTSVVTWSPGVITLTNEFLFFALAWEITTASGSNSGNVQFRTGQASTGTFFVTPDLGTGVAPTSTRPVIVGQAVGRGALV